MSGGYSPFLHSCTAPVIVVEFGGVCNFNKLELKNSLCLVRVVTQALFLLSFLQVIVFAGRLACMLARL
jgi:hypothetical protein